MLGDLDLNRHGLHKKLAVESGTIKLLKPLDLNGHRIADVLETSDRVYFNPVGKIKQLKHLYDHYICEPGGVFCMQHELSYRIKVS